MTQLFFNKSILFTSGFAANLGVITSLCARNDVIFSDSNANPINLTIGDCIDIDFSNSLLGDLNVDGNVNVQDIVILVNMVLGISEQSPNADLNNDDLINVLDVVILIGMILEE